MNHLFDFIRQIEEFRDAFSSSVPSTMTLWAPLSFVERRILVLFIVQS